MRCFLLPLCPLKKRCSWTLQETLLTCEYNIGENTNEVKELFQPKVSIGTTQNYYTFYVNKFRLHCFNQQNYLSVSLIMVM